MSSQREKPGMRGTPNSPHPAKFLKEMETLIPALKRKGIIPMTREEARAMGEKGTQAAAKKAEAEHLRRLGIIGQRLDEYMKELTPLAFGWVLFTGWTWWFGLLGYRYSLESTRETVLGCPNIACTRIQIFRRRCWPFSERLVKAERLVWEEPKPPKDFKAPKPLIIKP